MQPQVECDNAEVLFLDSNMNGDNMQITYNFSTRKRGLSWSDMETRTLLEVWTERNNLFEADDLCSANGQIYRTIANEMAERGYQKSAIQCKTRMKTLKRAYKHCRMLMRTRGKVKKLCRFYKEIDYIIRKTASKKKLGVKRDPNLDAGAVSSDVKQSTNGSWESSKSGGTEGDKFDQLSMECEVIENDLSDEIEISDDDDEEIDEEEENMAASTPEMKTSPSMALVSTVSTASESKPVETKLEAFSLNPIESKWLNVISLDDSTNTSNTNSLSTNRNLLLEMGEMAKPNTQNQVTNTRPSFPFPETSGVFLPEKEPISHLNEESKYSNRPVVNQVDMISDQPLEALSEPVAKEIWVNNLQGVRNILQKQGISQFSQPNENRVTSSSTFQTNKHFQPPLDIIQISQPVLDKSLECRTLTSSSSSSSAAAAAAAPTSLMPMEILVPGNEVRTETNDLRKRRQTAEVNHFEQTLKSVVDSFTNTLEQMQSKQLQAESLRLDIEMKKLEVERERQALEREKMKNEVQRHREDREHQFAMLKMILEHVSSPRPSLAAENIGLDSSTSQLLNSINPKT